MKKLSLRTYFALSLCLFGLILLGSILVLWSASTRLESSTAKMKASIRSIVGAEEVIDDLEVHHREALLRPLEDASERQRRRSEAEADLWTNFNRLASDPDSMVDARRLNHARIRIVAYFELSKKLDLTGMHGERLYVSTAEAFDRAESQMLEMVLDLRDQAHEVQNEAAERARSYKVGALASLAGLLVIVGLLVLLFHRLVFQPIQQLQKNIISFTRTRTLPSSSPAVLTEINEIFDVFTNLANSLKRQNEQRLISLSSVAHDLKNPLSAIQMSVDFLSDSHESPKSRDQVISVIGRQVQQLRRLVDDLLDSTRIEAGQVELKKRPTDLNSLLRDSVLLFGAQSDLHKIELSVPDHALSVSCDPARILQVANNLISNAIKYSPDGGRIEVSAKTTGDFAMISVCDEGIGIDARDFETIFQPFKRSRYIQNDIPGVGLGLSITRKIVEAHGGTVQVQSQPGKGSIFIVRLPLLSNAEQNAISPEA